ncbi:MAG TPA: hypothetical protein VL749_02960 [Patescibacteria group bacterium]|nr:hypothetical protein [Patescibacteria group bacterium]
MTSANPSIPAPAPRRELEPTHPCIRCGREGVAADAGLCEVCNPLELSQPAATQMHGIAALGILLFIVVLFVVGRAVIAGAGPFTGQVTGVAPAPAVGGLSVTITVRNEGTNAGAITCWVAETPPRVGAPGQSVQSPLVQPGQSATFTALVTKLGSTPLQLAADCSTQ